MRSAHVHTRNLLANWTSHGANLLVMFFLSPFIVNELGPAQYGIWSLLTVLTGYLGVLDMGVRASTGRHVVLYLGKGDAEALDETIRTGIGFFTALGGVLVAVGVVLGLLFPEVFEKVPPEYHNLARVLLPVLAANVWLSAFRVVLASVLTAHDRFDLARGADVVSLALRTGGTLWALVEGWGIVGLTLAVVGSNAVGLLMTYGLARRVYPALRVAPPLFRSRRLKELFGYGLAASVVAVSVKVIGQTDLVIVGAAIDVASVTVYSVGAMLVYYSWSFVSQVGHTFFPPLQRAVARGEKGDTRWLYFRQVYLAMLFTVPVYIGLGVFGREFISLWMAGPKFDSDAVTGAALVMLILSVAKLPLAFSFGSRHLLAAAGSIRINAVMALTEATTNVGLSVAFAVGLGWGIHGVAAGTLVARLATTTFVQPYLACRKLGISWPSYALRVGGRLIASSAVFAGICLAVQRAAGYWLEESWGRLFVQAGLSCAAYVPLAVLVILPEADRRRVLRKLRRSTVTSPVEKA